MAKTISFITPCYNDGNSIEKLINSLRDQDLQDIEVIVVNDSSTDNSRLILDGLKEQGKIDKLIHLEKNQGACVARNTGAKVAEGKYFSFLPADAILYPGMATIWYDMLEAHLDYDFLYGGYRFIDEEGEPIPGNDLFFQPFEPYILETSNYIDGSFPIRAESFWKFAKIMNQPDGLWDPNIKSLQDWDFWLSVVRNGGKGIYIQDIFFGTTMPHPGGLSYDSSQHWIERTEAIKKKHGIPIRNLCVASLGAAFHAKRIAKILDADFKEMPSFKPHHYDALYLIGFYPQFAKEHDAMFLENLYEPQKGRTAAKKIIHFVGSDVWQLFHCSVMSLKIWREYFKNAVDVILCESDFIQQELKELGIENIKVVPIPPLFLYAIKPLPKEFTVACYQPGTNAEFYRPNEMYEIAKKCPNIKFKFFGNPYKVGIDPALPLNIEFMGYINDMEKFIGDCSAIMRFPQHDGLPISVIEFLLAGRYSIQSVPLAHTMHIQNFSVDEVVSALNYLKENVKEPNQTGSDYWRQEVDHKKYAKTIKELAAYKPKEYWENRAKGWAEQAKVMSIEEERKAIEPIFKKINPKSVLDIGCGDGRWYPILKEWGFENYLGCDISENLIKAAQFRFPAIKDNFFASKVEDLNWTKTMFGPEEKKDLVFSYTCLEHITEEEFPKAVEAIKKVSKMALLIEPTNFKSRYYCHNHDYEKYFNVIEKVQLKDKVIFLCQN